MCCKIMAQIKMLTGVVEVGLFCKMAKAAYFGNEVRVPPNVCFCLHVPDPLSQDGSVSIRWLDGKVEHIVDGVSTVTSPSRS